MTQDWFSFRSETTPEQIAIITAHNGKEYSYKEINQIANIGASYFQYLGIKKGDRIAIIAFNCIEYIYLFAIAQKTGIVIVPINYRLTQIEISILLQEIEPVLVLHDEFYQIKTNDLTVVKNFKELFGQINSHDSAKYKSPDILPDDEIFILFTSGSSGLPKGVMYTRKMLFWNSVNTMISVTLHADTSTIVCMPPFHTGGWNVLLTPLLHVGGTIILMRKFDPERILTLLEEYHCSIFMGVPTMLKMMADQPIFKSVKLDTLKYILVGGESISIQLIETYHEKGIFIRQGYGMTEAGPNLTSLHENDAIRKIGSIGKPNLYVKTKIVSDEGIELDNNKRGQLLIKGPMTMKAYFKQTKETSKILNDGWLKTGDIALKDEEGFLYIVDRIKNMYISGGENIYPAEIEHVLKSHPNISEVVVISVADKKWGESGKAILSLHSKSEFSYNDLKAFCTPRLSKYKIPKYLVVLDKLPKNESGKLDRKKLKETFSNR